MSSCTCRKGARCLTCMEKGPLHLIAEDIAPDAAWRNLELGLREYLGLWADFNDAYPESPQT